MAEVAQWPSASLGTHPIRKAAFWDVTGGKGEVVLGPRHAEEALVRFDGCRGDTVAPLSAVGSSGTLDSGRSTPKAWEPRKATVVEIDRSHADKILGAVPRYEAARRVIREFRYA